MKGAGCTISSVTVAPAVFKYDVCSDDPEVMVVVMVTGTSDELVVDELVVVELVVVEGLVAELVVVELEEDELDEDELEEVELDENGLDEDELEVGALGLEDGPVVKSVGTDDEDPTSDDDEELLAKDNAVTGDVTMLDNESIEEGTPRLDGALVESTIPSKVEFVIDEREVGVFEIEGLAKEPVGKAAIELPLLTTEGALEDEGINWYEVSRLEGPVLWPVTTLVEVSRPAGLVGSPVTKPVEGDPTVDELKVSLIDTLIEGISEPVAPTL